MSNDTKPTRPALEKTVEINASPDDVWNAISTGEGISRWFTFETRVTPGVGGEMWGRWGEADAGTMKFDVWEPGKRIRLVEDTMVPGLPQFVEYLIEAGRGSTTTLRLVHSGIGAESDWDEMYDSVNRGWDVFMLTLKHALERHPGRDRTIAYATCQPDMSRVEAWERLIGPDALALRRDSAGDDDFGTFSLGAGPERRLAGRSWIWNPPKDLAGVIDDLGDAPLWIAIEHFGKRPNLSMTLSSFSAPESAVRDVEGQWQAMLDHLFPASE